MKRVDLEDLITTHEWKPGKHCPFTEPNVTEDCIFYEAGIPIGFYMKKMPEKMSKLADLADSELRSDRVPKSLMERSDIMLIESKYGISRKDAMALGTSQYSCIIGSVPPKPHMRRYAPNHSSVHTSKTAQTFIKAMLKLALESEKLIKEITPNVWEKQIEVFQGVSDEWKFGNIFTSSISNFNISAQYHRDTGNLKDCVNVIITKRRNSKGGNLNVPDYDVTFDQCDNSILVYPAWKSLHGVTPIIPLYEGGYRNSLVFYPLAAFLKSKLNPEDNKESEEE